VGSRTATSEIPRTARFHSRAQTAGGPVPDVEPALVEDNASGAVLCPDWRDC
jgi:hypothetical protein